MRRKKTHGFSRHGCFGEKMLYKRIVSLIGCSAAFYAGFAQVSDDDPNWFKLGETIAFGQNDPDGRKFPEMRVPIRFPKQIISTPSDFEPHLRWGDYKIQLNEWGNIERIYEATGGWDEFRTRWERAQDRIAQDQAHVWKVRAQIFRRTDVLYKRDDGVLIPQRAYINLQQIRFIVESFARFKALVEAFTDGAVEVQLTFGVEEEPVFGSYEGDQVWSFHPFDAAENYLRCRFNYSDYDAVVYFYHPGLTNSFSFGGTIGRSNNATLSYVIVANGREGYTRIGHTEALLHEWLHQIENTWSRFGYGLADGSALPNLHAAEQNGYGTDLIGYTGWFAWIRDFMTYIVTPGMWAKMTNRADLDWDEALKTARPSDGTLYVWSNVKDDPWAKLPYLTARDLATRIRADNVEIKTGSKQLLFVPRGISARTPILNEISETDHSFNNQLSFDREAMARIGYRDRDLIFMRWDAADFVLSNLGEGDAPSVLGYIGIDGKLVVVADLVLNNNTTAEINALKLGSRGSRIEVKGSSDVFRNAVPQLQFASERGEVQVTVTEWTGVAMHLSGGRELQLPRDSSGTMVLRATAVAADGSKSERPFVVRVIDPVSAHIEAVGTARMSGREMPISVRLTNMNSQQTATILPTLPTGWQLSGIPSEVDLAPFEEKQLTGVLTAPNDAPEGTITVAFDITAKGYDGPIRTERLRVLRFTKPTLEHATFELTTRPGAGTDGWNAVRPDNGGWKVRALPGGFKGQGLRITDSGGTRWGRVNAFGGYAEDGHRDPNWMGYDVSDYPYLDFYLKTTHRENLGLVATLSDGKRYTIMLTGRYLEQWGESRELARAKFIPNGEWQRIVYDLNSELKRVAGEGRHIVVDIGFGDTRQFCSNQQLDEDTHTHYVDEWRITREANLEDNTTKEDPDAELTAAADAQSGDMFDRARFAATLTDDSPAEARAAVRAMLKDKDAVVRVNAAAAFARVRDEDSLTLLSELARLDPDQTAGKYAVRALELIGTPKAYEEIETAARMNRFEEYVKAEAAMVLARTRKDAYINAIGNLYASNSWMVRAAGARGLGLIGSVEAKRRQLVFLLEVDPFVRLEVSLAADVDVEPIGRRMEWSSVNDPSNVVRAYSYAALAKSGDSATRRLGYDGLKDEDPEIRRILCAELGRDGKEAHKPILVEMLGDRNPDVRGASVSALLALPGDRVWGEFASLAGEKYEQVLIPLVRGAENRKLVIPSDFLSRLRSHRNAEVRELAGRLLGENQP